MNFNKSYSTIDLHVAGEPLRIITHGVPEIKGETQLDKRQYCIENLDYIRETLMYEPRGHDGMYGCIITPPSTPNADIGVLFMHNEGWSTMCGHGVIAVVTMAIETGMVEVKERNQKFIIDCPCGPVTAYANCDGNKVKSVSFENVPSFVYKKQIPLTINNLEFNVDISYGGAFYAIVDVDDLNLTVDNKNIPELQNWGDAIKHELERSFTIEHPFENISGIYGVIFSNTPQNLDESNKNITVFADKQIDRSPCGSGTAARAANLYEYNILNSDGLFKHSCLTNSEFEVAIHEITSLENYSAIIPKIKGSGFITGFHQFVVDPEDPLKNGFLLK